MNVGNPTSQWYRGQKSSDSTAEKLIYDTSAQKMASGFDSNATFVQHCEMYMCDGKQVLLRIANTCMR